MPSSASVFSLFMSCVVVLLSSGCQGHQVYRPLSTNHLEEPQIFRRGGQHLPKSSEDFPKVASDIFGSSSEDSSSSSDRNRFQEDNDLSLSSDELSMLELPSLVSKRRKGPTLSVVNPLEVLRQRLMLDLAKQRIRENQKQILANGELLEKIGKRSSRHTSADDFRALVEGGFQP